MWTLPLVLAVTAAAPATNTSRTGPHEPAAAPVPAGFLVLPAVRAFLGGPLPAHEQYVPLPGSSMHVAVVEAWPAQPDGPSPKAAFVLRANGAPDGALTAALAEAIRGADPDARCLGSPEHGTPNVAGIGGAVVIGFAGGRDPRPACFVTWDPKRSTIDVTRRDLLATDAARDALATGASWSARPSASARATFHASSAFVEFAGPARPAQLMAATLPGSGLLLVYVQSGGRYVDERDPGAGFEAKVFVHDPSRGAIDAGRTVELGDGLSGPTASCGGLGTVSALRATDAAVTVEQFYVPGGAHLNCSTLVRWDARRKLFDVRPLGPVVDTASAAFDREREDLGELDAGALALWKAGRRSEAIASWRSALQDGRRLLDEGEICNNLGFAYWAIGDHASAERVLLECEQQFPERPAIQLNLGDVYRDSGRKAEAVARYRRFLGMPISPRQQEIAEKRLRELGAAR